MRQDQPHVRSKAKGKLKDKRLQKRNPHHHKQHNYTPWNQSNIWLQWDRYVKCTMSIGGRP